MSAHDAYGYHLYRSAVPHRPEQWKVVTPYTGTNRRKVVASVATEDEAKAEAARRNIALGIYTEPPRFADVESPDLRTRRTGAVPPSRAARQQPEAAAHLEALVAHQEWLATVLCTIAAELGVTCPPAPALPAWQQPQLALVPNEGAE